MSIDSNYFSLLSKLPPYVFSVVNELKYSARRRGDDIIDFGMGNHDQPTPKHIVEKLMESSVQGKNHRYSISAGLPKLKLAISDWYKKNYNVSINPDTETIVTIGSKEGLSHLMIAMLSPGEVVLVPDPCYPIHSFSVLIARGDIREYDSFEEEEMIASILTGIKKNPKPKALIISFPSTPTTQTVNIEFFNKIVEIAKENKIKLGRWEILLLNCLCLLVPSPLYGMQMKDIKKFICQLMRVIIKLMMQDILMRMVMYGLCREQMTSLMLPVTDYLPEP